MRREPINRVIERDSLPAPRCVRQLVHTRGLGLLGEELARALQLLQALDREGGTAECRLCGLLDAEDERFLSVATVVGLGPDSLGYEEAEVVHELVGCVDGVGFVFVVDVGDVMEADLLHWGPVAGHGGRLVCMPVSA